MTNLSKPLHTGERITQNKLNHITTGFLNLSLPKEEWTHAAHLITGLYLIQIHGLAKAEALMPTMIKAYNEAKGGINSDSEGYHHTLTIFYLRILSDFKNSHTHLTMPKLCEHVLASPQGARKYPLTRYTKDILFSLEARKNWVEPV